MRTCLRYALPLVFVLLGAVLSRQTEPSVVVSREELTATSFRVPALRVRPRGPVRGRVLLAHGVTASKETMFRLAEAFATAGYECLSVDFPGHGESRRAFGNLEDAEETLVAAARALGTVDVVVGFSMGAGVAARCIEARRLSPGRFIALGATPHGADLHLLGAHDELVDAPLGAIVSPWSDHALEPFDPVLVNAAVSWVASNTAGAAPTWWAVRLAGVLLLLAGTLFGTALALPRFPRRAWPGALTGLAVIAALGPGIDGT
jgi:pimeloyl-ACP methyl ester carboxylesterase